MKQQGISDPSDDQEREPVAERDHRKLGRALEIFAFDDEVGRGLPLWLPNGTVIRDELETLMKELEFEAGYQRVVTPHLAKSELYQRTGHLPHFAESVFPLMQVGDAARDAKEAFCLKPMNCPHHHKIFAARKRSYRELPVRFAEYGQCYRYEDSGALSGLSRTRGMSMNDAHIYCSREQIASECASVLALHQRVYRILGLEKWSVRLSTRDRGPDASSRYVDAPEAWLDSEAALRQVLLEAGLSFEEGPGEAAFYGPKIDFQFRTASGREETASTLQLDFAIAERLGLNYVGPDGKAHHPYIIHRAPLGTHERFVALLLEHYAGAFPTWLAPVQVRVLPVSRRFSNYAESVVKALRQARVRAELDDSSESLSKRIRNARAFKIPNLLVVGEREQTDGSVALRRLSDEQHRTLPLAEFMSQLCAAIAQRSCDSPAEGDEAC